MGSCWGGGAAAAGRSHSLLAGPGRAEASSGSSGHGRRCSGEGTLCELAAAVTPEAVNHTGCMRGDQDACSHSVASRTRAADLTLPARPTPTLCPQGHLEALLEDAKNPVSPEKAKVGCLTLRTTWWYCPYHMGHEMVPHVHVTLGVRSGPLACERQRGLTVLKLHRTGHSVQG